MLGRTIVLCVNQSLVAVAYRQFATVDQGTLICYYSLNNPV